MKYERDKSSPKQNRISRREFLKILGAGATIFALGGLLKIHPSSLPPSVRGQSPPAARIDYVLKGGVYHAGFSARLLGSGFVPGTSAWIQTGYGKEQASDVRVTDTNNLLFTLINPSKTSINPVLGAQQVGISVRRPDGFESNTVWTTINSFAMLVFGDSVTWGQGLREPEKFHSLVSGFINTRFKNIHIFKDVKAHSGAIIGVGDNIREQPIHGEIPTSYPTILQQVNDWNPTPYTPEVVNVSPTGYIDLILVNGGINDVGLGTILNPDPTAFKFLSDLVRKRCHDDMITLLQKITAKFPNPETKIIVTGYYQIISRYSNLAKVAITLCMLGLISGPAGGALACLTAALLPLAQFLIINNKCAIFAREANLHLREAVDAINRQEGLENKGLIPRIFFADPGFDENNAVFASAPLIYGLDIFNTTPTLDFAKFAEDSLKWYRRDRCNEVRLSIPFFPGGRAPIYCRIASVGHPNPRGSQRYAQAIFPILDRPVQPITPPAHVIAEDCIAFDPTTASAKNIQGSWKVVVGKDIWMLDFGADGQTNAQKALDIIKNYKFTSQCFVGRPNPGMQYYLVNGSKAPNGTFTGQDCISFNPQTISVQQIGQSWKVVDGTHWILDFGNSQDNANKALNIIKKYGFSQICFVGRPNAPMMYFLGG